MKSSQTQEKFIVTSRSHEEPEGIRCGCDPMHWQWRGFQVAHLQMWLVVRCMRKDMKREWQDGCRKLAPCLGPTVGTLLTGQHCLLWTLEDEQRKCKSLRQKTTIQAGPPPLRTTGEGEPPRPTPLHSYPWECWQKPPSAKLKQSVSKHRQCVRWLPFATPNPLHSSPFTLWP